MCGIAGIVFLRKNAHSLKNTIQKMSQTIRHRGPDDEGFVFFSDNKAITLGSNDTQRAAFSTSLSYSPQLSIHDFNDESYSVALAHRRLSIIDLGPMGHQPMCDNSERYWITFNGEIYNYIELRKELEREGINFITQTDTEVVINAYKKWGKECVNRFNGMWSFVIYDKHLQHVFASRDRFGVKPFYYYFKNDVFCFASELKAIVAQDFYKKEINSKAVFDFFEYNEQEYEEEGFFKNIFELFPSHNLIFDFKTGELKKEKYYDLTINTSFEEFNVNTFNEHVEKTKSLFTDSVRLRLRADVDVGACLSGGIDSSAISVKMNELLKGEKSIHLFTASFPENKNVDETNWAKQIVDVTNSVWHQCKPNSNGLFEEMNNLVYSQDIPLWSSSTYAQFKVLELCKQNNIKVVLDGQGGDELFAGYLPYYANYWNEIKLNKGFTTVIKELKKSEKLTDQLVFWIKENAKQNNHSLMGKLINIKNSNKQFLSSELYTDYDQKFKIVESNLNKALQNEFVNTRLKLYLKCEDRCSMWHSVEARTPFADDVHLIENTFSIPGNYKLYGNTTKKILREATKELLPSAIYNRKDKMGYVTPNNNWLLSNINAVKQIISEADDDYLNKKMLLKKLDELLNSSSEKTIVFKALTFIVWRRSFGM
jgi:asparagine synthase (glutamine-hydrolysing)